MILSVCTLIAGLSCAAQDGGAMTLDEVVKANAASIAGINSLVVRVKQSRSISGGAVEPLKPIDEYQYWKQGEEERMTFEYLGRPVVPNPENKDNQAYSDASNGPSGFREITGCDPRSPPKLGEYSLSGAQGILEDRKTTVQPFRTRPDYDLLMTVFTAPDYLSLRDLVEAHPSSKLIATPANSPRHCYEVEVSWSEGWRRVSVDPAVNFMIRREEYGLSGTANAQPSFVEAESFRDCGDGAFIPTRILAKARMENGKELRLLTEVEVVSCNTPIPPEELQVVFPDWLIVVDRKTGKTHNWGPEDKPRQTFDSVEEHRKWLEPRRNKAKSELYSRPSPYRWVLVAGAITVILAAIVVFRNWRERRLAA